MGRISNMSDSYNVVLTDRMRNKSFCTTTVVTLLIKKRLCFGLIYHSIYISKKIIGIMSCVRSIELIHAGYDKMQYFKQRISISHAKDSGWNKKKCFVRI